MTAKLLVVLFWISAAVILPAEKYYVTFVKGNVLVEKTRKPLKVGDALNPEDKLIFSDKSARVSFISPGKGRFDINPQAVKSGSKGELLAIVKSALIPASSTYHLSTRSLIFDGYDPRTYFTSSATHGRILLIKSEPLPINPSYKLDAVNFFFIQFTAEGKTITRKVDQNEKGIIFSDKLFLNPSGTVAEKVSLCYQTNISGTARSSVVAAFTPVLAAKEEIIGQIELMREMLGITDKKKLKTELSNHIFDNYGKAGEEVLNSMFGI